MTYFRRREADYHWRGHVSRSCSEREGVVPRRYGRQTKRFMSSRWVRGVIDVWSEHVFRQREEEVCMGLIALE